MKRLVPAFAIVFWWASAMFASEPTPLRSLRAVSALSNDQASLHPPVAFEATVTYYAHNLKNMNVQDDGIGIYVKLTGDVAVAAGDRVLIEGTAEPSFLPYVIAKSVKVMRHGMLPKPVSASFDDLFGIKDNCKLITVRGVVRAADLVTSAVTPTGRLHLLMHGGYIDLEVDSHDIEALKRLLDAEVEVTGTAGRKFDGKMQQTGAKVKVSSLADIKVLQSAPASPWSLPITPLDKIITGAHVRDLTQRLLVHGSITYYQPGSAVVLQDGDKSLWVATQTSEPMGIGDVAEATGFPETHDGLLMLNHAEVQDSHVQAPIPPQPATWRQLAFWGRSKLGAHQDDLVSIDGRVVAEIREAAQDDYILVADGKLFTAVYRHPPAPAPLPPMLQVPLGSTIRVTGICIAVQTDPFNDEAPFNILLRSFDDIAVVAEPSMLNIRNLTILAGLLLLAVVAVGARSWMLERKVRLQTAALAARIEADAALERKRSRILEDINGSTPLAEVLEEITEMVSVMLEGAPCWCEVADGARRGNGSTPKEGVGILRKQILSHSGQELGGVLAQFRLGTLPTTSETEALTVGAGLAALAIETRRLYSDLRHRSEFDLLTDTHNRFSLESDLDKEIAESRETARIFGLVYIDLDRFKQINDRYGHRMGDLYLQEAARRMKHQLRSRDSLARLGGDEFAVLLPAVRSRFEVEEIAGRLESCFGAPFALEGALLHGSASVGTALYPEDGVTRDTLLNAADAAMYAAKSAKSPPPFEQGHIRR